jgi:dihydrofolate synthase/folylpolyglutamate synthase
LLVGEHQRLNAALALATIEALRPVLPVSEAQLQAGLATVSWPGRFQIIQHHGGVTLVLDGAHNPAGVEALAVALQKHFPGTKPTLILGMLADKDWQPMCRRLASLASKVLTVPVASNRSAEAIDLAAACRAAAPAATEACASLPEAMAKAGDDSLVVIAGSLYLVGEALEWLGLSPVGNAHERGLNEWGGHSTADQSTGPAR